MNCNNSKKENERRKQCNVGEHEDEKQGAKLMSEGKETMKVARWRSMKLSHKNETTHGWWATLHNDRIKNFGQNFNFRFEHKCALKYN